MYIIKELKKKKNYVMPPKPNFKSRKQEMAWLRRQKMAAVMLNIKSIQIQVKDIKELIHSEDSVLLGLYASMYPFAGLNDEQYITISKFKNGNHVIIQAIINTDWLINKESIDKVSDEVLELECAYLEKRMKELLQREQTDMVQNFIEHCRYKLESIKQIQKERNKEQSISLKLV